ncbi:MAG: hypothetical protein A2Y24_07120 [Clostridiales bacterium GWE2_32_10]|nr:MAG: hypothetical protein A2Y24_07120 [Clostridiales bacterium GWE2_32_10]
MNKLRRALATILAVAMLATNVNVGFAAKATFTDVDSEYTTAVSRLASIDILTGYEDGTFKPEGTITRAEAAAVIVRMLGKEKVAKASASVTQFKDMTGHWANGYVNTAAGAGVVKGYEDGTFKPDAQVTYAEIVTMMVRALGAGEAVGSSGTWPTNYLIFAQGEDLTEDVAVVPNAPATRGDVAIIANETLDATMWEATGYNTDGTRTYAKSEDENKTLFTEKLELTKYEMYTVTEELANDDGTYSFKAISDEDGAVEEDFTFADDMQVAVWPGQEIDIWVNDDDDVVSMQAAKDSKQKVVDFTDITDLTSTKAKLQVADGTIKSYDVDGDTDYVLDGDDTVARGDISEDLDLSGRAIVDKDGDIVRLFTYTYEKGLIVKEVKYDEDDNKYTIKADTDQPYANGDSSLIYELDKDDIAYVKDAKGNDITLANIKEGDMVLYCGASNKYLLAFPADTVEGTVDGDDPDTIEIGGKEYDYSLNTVENDDLVDDSISVDDEVKAYLGVTGKVVMLDKVTGSAGSGDYGIITDFYAYEDDRGKVKVKIELLDVSSGETTGLKVFDAEKTDEEGEVFTDVDFFDEDAGSAGEYRDDTELDQDDADYNNYAEIVGQAIKYEIKSDKVILYAVNEDEDEVVVGANTSDYDADKQKFSIGGTSYYVDLDEVKAYQATEIDSDNVLTVKSVNMNSVKDTDNKEFTLIDLDDDGEFAAYVYIPMTDSNDDDKVVDTKQTINKSNDDYIGVITKVRELTGDDAEITVITKDGSQKFYVDEDERDEIDATAFDGTSIDLDDADLTTFKGLLVSYSADDDGYVTSENIQFSSKVSVAKFYEVNSKDEVKLLNSDDDKLTIDSYRDMFIIESDIDVDAAVAASTTIGAGTNGVVTITAEEAGYAGNSLAIKVVLDNEDDEADNLTVTITEGVITVKLADNADNSLAEASNTALLVAAEIDDLDEVEAEASGTGVTAFAAAVAQKSLEDGLDTVYTFDDVETSDISDISEVDEDIDEYDDATDDEANTVYYYLVEIDEDGDLVDVDATDMDDDSDDAVSIMIFDPNEDFDE